MEYQLGNSVEMILLFYIYQKQNISLSNELNSIECPPNHYGLVCAKCKECQSSDSLTSLTGRCIQCPPSFCGEECQYSCPLNCLDLICDQKTWKCSGCQNGYSRQECEITKASAVVVTTGQNFRCK